LALTLGNLTGLLDKIRPAVEATTYTGDRTTKNLAFVDAVARKNVELTMAQISEKSPVLKELQSSHALLITGAMYNIETAAVEFFS
jgi:carbonic anhydrase